MMSDPLKALGVYAIAASSGGDPMKPKFVKDKKDPDVPEAPPSGRPRPQGRIRTHLPPPKH